MNNKREPNFLVVDKGTKLHCETVGQRTGRKLHLQVQAQPLIRPKLLLVPMSFHHCELEPLMKNEGNLPGELTSLQRTTDWHVSTCIHLEVAMYLIVASYNYVPLQVPSSTMC